MANTRRIKKSGEASESFPSNLGESIGRTVTEMWRSPVLRAHRDNDRTQFVFTFPFSIPGELKSRNPEDYKRLFAGKKKKGLASAIVKAYDTAHYDGEPIKSRIRFLLREVVLTSLQILIANRKDMSPQDESKVKEEQLSLRKSVVKRGQPKRERKRNRTAKHLARRYRELLPEVRKIREFIKVKESSLKDTELRQEIDRVYQYSWIPLITNGCALENLLPIPTYESSIKTLSSTGWTVRQLAVGIIVCEERDGDPKFRLGPTTIYEKYISLGNRLIDEDT